MESLIAAYAVAAVSLGAYAAWLLIATGRVSRRLRQLRSFEPTASNDRPAKKLA